MLLFLLDLNLFLLFVFVAGRNISNLLRQRTESIAGIRFKSRLIASTSALILVPTLLLFLVAGSLVRQTLFQWPMKPVRAVMDDALQLKEALLDETRVQAERTALGVAQGIAGASRTGAASNVPKAWLAGERALRGLAFLRIFDTRNRIVGEALDPEQDTLVLPKPGSGPGDLFQAETPVQTILMEDALARTMIVSYARVARSGEKPSGYVECGRFLPALPKALAENLTERYEELRRQNMAREDARETYLLLLLLATMLILFASLWSGALLSNHLALPVSKLSQASLELARGNLDIEPEAVGRLDELGDVAHTLRWIAEELKQSRSRVQDSAFHLSRSHRELDERRKYIETLLANIPAGVVSLDRFGIIKNFNTSAMRLLSAKTESCLGEHYRDVFAGKEFLELRVLIDKVMGIRDIRLVRELKIRSKNRSLTLAVSFTALKDAADAYIGMIIVLDDLSEFIKAQKVAAWREVARRIAHEIKNPLTPIKLSAQRIARRLSDGELESKDVILDCTETIIQEVNSLKTLVDSFSRFARMPEVKPVPSSINQIVTSALMPYETTYGEIEFLKQLQERIPQIKLDPEQFKRALVNLIDNAISAMNGSGQIEVVTRYDSQMQIVTVEVSDDGPGIAHEIRDKLFLPYFSAKKGGTGLGLAIVNRIVSDHRGYIKMEENKPRGARFVIEVPA